MNQVEKEKELAMQFFQTAIGKKIVANMKEMQTKDKEIIELSGKVELLEKQLENVGVSANVLTPQTEKETIQILEEAVSLFHSKKCPQYLCNITTADGKTYPCYTTNLQEMMKIPNTTNMEEINYE